MQVSSEINRLASLDATRRAQAGSTPGNSFATELARAQNLPSSLTGSSGGAPSLGLSLDTLLQSQGATDPSALTQDTAGQDASTLLGSDPLNQPQTPTQHGAPNPLRSHRPLLSGLTGSEGP